MRVAIIDSRSLNIDISKFIPEGVTEIVSGGAKGKLEKPSLRPNFYRALKRSRR